MAPEIQLQKSKFAVPACDAFSLGLLICSIYNGGHSLIQAQYNPACYIKELGRVRTKHWPLYWFTLPSKIRASLPSLWLTKLMFASCRLLVVAVMLWWYRGTAKTIADDVNCRYVIMCMVHFDRVVRKKRDLESSSGSVSLFMRPSFVRDTSRWVNLVRLIVLIDWMQKKPHPSLLLNSQENNDDMMMLI